MAMVNTRRSVCTERRAAPCVVALWPCAARSTEAPSCTRKARRIEWGIRITRRYLGNYLPRAPEGRSLMYPHRIRLRGPWEHEPLPDTTGTRHRRRFGYPGQIDATERVWITCEGVTGRATVTLNKHLLGSP